MTTSQYQAPEQVKRHASHLFDCHRQIEGNGVDTVILGCTELPLVLTADDLPAPLIDTARCHAEALVARAQG